MIEFKEINKVDTRHTVNIIDSISISRAIQLNKDGSYESVIYMTDDIRTHNNEAVIDATEEELEVYRKHCKEFKKGDKVLINKGRKMKGKTKIVKKMFTYRPTGTYGHQDVEYIVFTDNTKVNKLNCIIL